MEIKKLCYQAMAVFNKNWVKIVGTILLFLFIQDAASQTNPTPFRNMNQTVSLEGSITLDSITRYLHKNTGIRCSFNSVKVKGSSIIWFEKKKYSLEALLNYIRKTTSLHFNFYKDYVIFTDHPLVFSRMLPKKMKQNKQHVFGPFTESLFAKHRKARITPNNVHKFIHPTRGEDAINLHPIKTSYLLNIARLPADYKFNMPAPSSVFKNVPSIKKIITPENPTIQIAHRNSPKPTRLYAQLGYNLTDALFNNLTAEIGLAPIHFIANFGTNFKTTSLGWGIGSIIFSKHQFQLKVNAVINSLSSNFNFYDSIAGTENLQIKGNLYSIGPELIKHLKNKRWNVRLSIQYNQLASKYHINGQITPPALLPDKIKNNSKKYSLAQPLVPLNTFNGNEINYKRWIGLTLGFFYKI